MKPILFNTEMVRAIQEGRKTVTRRVMKPQPTWIDCGSGKDNVPMQDIHILKNNPIEPLYHPGDVLWVRETWGAYRAAGDMTCFVYKAEYIDAENENKARKLAGGWHPSIHMPREAARLFLRVESIRAERLRDIDKHWFNYDQEGMRNPALENISIAMQERFISIWNSTIKPTDLSRYGWEANPWVWVIQFERCERPEGCPGMEVEHD